MTASVNVVTGRKVFVGGVDLSGQENEVNMVLAIDEKEKTAFGDTSHVFHPGLYKVDLSQKGFVSYGLDLVDDSIMAKMAAAQTGVPVSITQQTGLEGEIAYFLKAKGFTYSPTMKVGELPSFDFGMKQDVGELARGTILIAKTELAAGTQLGTIFNVGAVLTGQKMYGALHVLGKSGSPTVDVIVQSAAVVGFGTPTSRITFAQQTGVGSEFKASAAGPITDAYWRISATIGGTGTPKATIFVVIGIV